MSDYAKIAGLIAEDFYKGRFDLSARKKVSSASSWSSMPHVECVNYLRESGASERTILLFITFIAAIDRGRDSEQVWWSGLELFDSHPEVFDPLALFNVSVDELSVLMNESDVSHKNEQIPQAWLDIARTIALESHCPISRVIYGNTVDAKNLLKDLGTRAEDGTNRFPLLSGQKTGSVWLRMLSSPGGAKIAHLDRLPISVDSYVTQATENLGMAKKDNLDPTKDAAYIQSVWQSAVSGADFEAPEGIRNTCAGLDPALSFFGRYGCGHCAKTGTPVRIGIACNHCRLFI